MRHLALAALAAMCARAQNTAWEALEDTWACAGEHMVREQVKAYRADSVKAKLEVARQVANRRCVGIPKGTVLLSYKHGGSDTISVVLNRPCYNHSQERWIMKAYWHTPLRFLKFPPLAY